MNPMAAQIYSIPALVRDILPRYTTSVRQTLDAEFCRSIDRVYLTGCGDSHHASVGVELAFELLAGLTTEALTALQFARYTVETLRDPRRCLVVGTSVSGEVARTYEGLLLARAAGARTLAMTAAPNSRIASAGDRVVDTTQPPFPDPAGLVVPGVRSYVANQAGLLLVAVWLGEQRDHLSQAEAAALRQEMAALADAAEETIRLTDETARQLSESWRDADEFVFCGSGPNYASAMFSAAKLLEATGDAALAQDTEEWAHLQYFAKAAPTPTFVLTAAERDASRAREVVEAALAIGRRVAVVAPGTSAARFPAGAVRLPLAGGVRELFSPVISAIPTSLFAAYRAEITGEPYFRGFGGGRSKEGGGGISRIRTSEIITPDS